MLISLSKKVAGKPRHVVLVAEVNEVSDAGYIIGTIAGHRAKYTRKFISSNSTYRYVFEMEHLDDLLLAFPMANKSTGLQRRLDRLNAQSLERRAVDPFPIPGLWDRKNNTEAKAYDYQYVAIADIVRFLIGEMDAESEMELVESYLQNDEMGLGKTFMALCSLAVISDLRAKEFRRRKRGLKVLVVAPKNGKFVWERENKRWIDFDYSLIDADQHRPHERDDLIRKRSTITIINPEMLRGEKRWDGQINGYRFKPKHPDLFNYTYDYVIFDEYHRFGSPTSQQSVGMLNLKAERFLPMSGTPFLNRPPQLWPVLHRCWPEVFPDYDTFKDSLEIKNHDGKVIGYNPKFARGLKDFMGERSIRRRKDNVLANLPPIVPIDVMIELNREQRRIYEKIKNELLMMLEDGSEKRVKLQTMVIRLKQACFSPELFGGSKHSAKIDELKATVDSYVQSGEKLLIGTEWVKAARILEREFAHLNPAFVDGSVTGQKRMAEADRFNTDPNCHLYIGTIGANREAVTLSAATTVVLTDKEWSPLVNAQFIGRSASGGLRGVDAGVPHVSVISMIAANTYEESVEEMLAFKQGTFDAMIEKDGGFQVEKSIMSSLRDLI